MIGKSFNKPFINIALWSECWYVFFIFRATLVSNIHREADRQSELRKGDKFLGTTL